jgi:hypothetical protein
MKKEEIGREEAKAEQEAFTPHWFCPLIKDMCHKICKFYKPARVERVSAVEMQGDERVERVDYYCEDGDCYLLDALHSLRIVLNQKIGAPEDY